MKVSDVQKLLSEIPLSRAAIAREIGVSSTYITLLAQGRRNPSENIVDKLAHLKSTKDMEFDKGETTICGPLAQLVEHLTFNQGVAGSRPARPTKAGRPNLLRKF